MWEEKEAETVVRDRPVRGSTRIYLIRRQESLSGFYSLQDRKSYLVNSCEVYRRGSESQTTR